MDMTGEYRIPAPRQRVWEALNDPEILKAAIPGCEELNKLSDNELEARVKAKVGPVSATFTGKVTLNDLNPPESYRIAGEGKGGAAGFAKGGAEVNLAEDGADTILRYSAKADVGGKLAQIGSRLIQGTAKKMADDFFGKFSAIVGERYAAERAGRRRPRHRARRAGSRARAAGRSAASRAAPAGAAHRLAPAAAAAGAACRPPPPAPRAQPVAFQPERAAAATTDGAGAGTAKPASPGTSGWSGAIVLVILLFWLRPARPAAAARLD